MTATKLTPSSTARVKAFVDTFIRSEFVENYISENTESGGYSRSADKRDRYERCHDAAENGADGMTHREAINDWRAAFHCLMCVRAHAIERLATAVDNYFDGLESWHENNGSIDQQIG